MKILSKNLKNIIGVIIVLILAFLGYGYFVKNSSNEDSKSAETLTATLPDDFLGKEIFEMYNSLQAINFNSKVFESPVLARLEDLTSALPVIPIGRDNPFAPLGATAPASPVVPKSQQ